MIGYKNVPGYLGVYRFEINLGESYLSVDKTKIVIPYVGRANPSRVAELSMYEYSTDNGETWATMTPSDDTLLDNLAFTTVGADFDFEWEVKEDLGMNVYNTYIRIRLRAISNGLESLIKYGVLYFKRTVYDYSALGGTIGSFPEDYMGVDSSILLKNAPKTK